MDFKRRWEIQTDYFDDLSGLDVAQKLQQLRLTDNPQKKRRTANGATAMWNLSEGFLSLNLRSESSATTLLARSNGFALERKPLLTLPSSGRTHKKHSPMIAGLNIAVNSTSGRVVTGHSFASTASCTNRTNEPASSSHYAGQEIASMTDDFWFDGDDESEMLQAMPFGDQQRQPHKFSSRMWQSDFAKACKASAVSHSHMSLLKQPKSQLLALVPYVPPEEVVRRILTSKKWTHISDFDAGYESELDCESSHGKQEAADLLMLDFKGDIARVKMES
jgi:hypothetical protein|uniref:Uncharacterized protein n=1 Tax=Eutreptiella gymnastica TaxID=73025 RepID=A0A7S4LAM0_9EUGL